MPNEEVTKETKWDILPVNLALFVHAIGPTNLFSTGGNSLS